MPGVSGVGISFGADRIYDVLNALDLYPADALDTVKVMFTNFGESEARASMQMIKHLRTAGVSAEIFPENSKMKKQMAYANALAIPFVAIVGETELAENKVTLKNMTTGDQELLTLEELIKRLAD